MNQRVDYNAATPAGVKAVVDLVFLRVSQINGCSHCIPSFNRSLAPWADANLKV